MKKNDSPALQQFRNEVGIKFQLYNGLFTALPFHRIENTGILLSLLLHDCEVGYEKGKSPDEIVEGFFDRQASKKTKAERTDMLFRFTQYAERQVVLFDALEDAAFKQIKNTTGPGTMTQLLAEVASRGKEKELREKLKSFCVQLVLTAHPTQFYPGQVLGIIHDATKAVMDNNNLQINTYLQQLGKTPFTNQTKPTPYDEAMSLIWFLENVFYNAAGEILSLIHSYFPDITTVENSVIRMGFWPGGDRDGNPFVKVPTTLRVAGALRQSILKCYYNDVRIMRRRLTFKNVEPLVKELEKILYNSVYVPANHTEVSQEILHDILGKMRDILEEEHSSLFIHLVDDLINKISVFGLFFATLDIRQESTIHSKLIEKIIAEESVMDVETYKKMNEDEKLEVLSHISNPATLERYEGVEKDCLHSIDAIQRIQENNGEQGCNRYIISQCRSALHMMEVYALFKLGGWQKENISVDIVPLFETVNDLENADGVMQKLYENDLYKTHLKQRGQKQTIMLGFSDGTKDGGYLMANWGIYKAKERLTKISEQYGIDVVFFDGRGGPPSRGGGKTHKFYASMGENIANKEIQVTVQGQTISSSFGTVDAAKYNIEQLLSAGLANGLFHRKQSTLQGGEELLITTLAEKSLEKYVALKETPHFMDYLVDLSPMTFYGEANIGSRPSKRGKGKLTLQDLRAIPYVGAWSQLKQNVPGFYGVGTALEAMHKAGNFSELKALYKRSLFVKTLFDNCEMAMLKCFFPLTAHFANDKKYSAIWQMVYDEFELTKKYILLLAGKKQLMEDYPVERLSISMRDRIVLPLSTIQQYAIGKLKETKAQKEKDVFKKLIVRCSFGIINAARNSV